MPASHVHHLRVYYEDTDFSGFVYHASYLKFLERGRTEFLRARGIVSSTLHREAGGLAFVVVKMGLEYRKPALMDDWLTVITTLETPRGASLRMAQAIFRDDTCLLRAEVTVAAVRGGRATRLPETVRAALGPE
jgi:acyl-CoA thioester hydrolase